MEKLLLRLVIPHDKSLHIIYGVICFAILNSMVASYITIPLIFIIAVVKEIYDSSHENHTTDFNDVVATMIGAIIGLICSL